LAIMTVAASKPTQKVVSHDSSAKKGISGLANRNTPTPPIRISTTSTEMIVRSWRTRERNQSRRISLPAVRAISDTAKSLANASWGR